MTAGELLEILEQANPGANLVARDITAEDPGGPHYEILRVKVIHGLTSATVKNPSPPDVIELSCVPAERRT
jgi:hypothetical protein